MQMLLLYVFMVSQIYSGAYADTTAPRAAHFMPSSANNGSLTLRIAPDPVLKGYASVMVKWQVFAGGIAQQSGKLSLQIPPSRHPSLVHLPAHLPTDNEDAWLRLDYHITRPSSSHSSPSSAGTKLNSPLIATEWLLLKPYSTDDFIPAAGELSFRDSNDVFTISSPKAFLQFDKETGLLLHFEADHLLFADSASLKPALWDSIQPHLQLFSTSTGTQLVIVRAEYTIPEVSSLLHLSYTINAAGLMLVEQSLEPDTTKQGSPMSRPDSSSSRSDIPLPHFGMTWLLPPGLDSITWYGLSSQDTIDAIPSIHSTHLPATEVRWCSITDHEGRGIRISADSNYLHISINPYTDTAMTHSGKLSTQVNISRAFPGVHAPYTRAPYTDIKFSYKITPILPPARRDHQ